MIEEKLSPKYSQGVCGDGAAILKDGERMTVEEILCALNTRPDSKQYKWKDEDEWRMYMDKKEPFKSQGMRPTWRAARELKE